MTTDPRHLEDVRDDLRRRGYLDDRFERFLLQDALKPREVNRTAVTLALKVGLLAGIALALVTAFALAYANGNLRATPFDLIPLFLHLFFPFALVVGAAFLVLCVLLALALRVYHLRRIQGFCLGAALLLGGLFLAAGVWRGEDLFEQAGTGARILLAVAGALAAFGLVRFAYQGLLSLAISLTDRAPRNRLLSRRWLAVGLLATLLALAVPGLLAMPGGGRPTAPASLPTAPGERVLLVGVDGILPEELDYLLERDELPHLARLLAAGPTEDGGGALVSYPRTGERTPATFWVSVATGLDSDAHGVTAIDSFRPLGVRTALARTGPTRFYWNRVAEPLGLASHGPLLSGRRRAPAVWDLAARGGAPALVVNWWSTYPARPLPGWMVAHGAYQLLEEGVPGALAPETAAPEVTALLDRVAAGAAELRGDLPAVAREDVVTRALLPDAFYRDVFETYLTESPRLAALYLPAVDIAAETVEGEALFLGDVIRREMRLLDRHLEGWLDGVGTLVLVLDPGRRDAGAPGTGRAILWRRNGCRGTASGDLPTVSPAALAAGLLRALGLPQSAELPDPPLCDWPTPPARVETYGAPLEGPTEDASREGEYLENLRALGYL